MLIRKLSAIAAICGFCAVSSPAIADENSDLKEMFLKQQKQLQELQNTVKKQQNQIEQQQTVHNEALTHYIKNEVDRALKDSSGSLLTLGSNVENLTIKGDLRVRYEDRNKDNGSDTDRFRQRFRLGFNWKTTDGWEINAGIATGDNGSAKSTNDTYSKDRVFESGDLFLDYAYAVHTFDSGMKLTLGQMKNPFIHSGLLWDTDVRPVGVALHDHYDSGIFYTLGGFQVRELGDDTTDAQMVALQTGYKADGVTAALAYYHFNDATTRNVVGDATGENDVQSLSAYVEYAGKTESFAYKVFGEYTHNLAADNDGTTQAGNGQPEDEDYAWALGAEIKVDKFKFGYTYAHFGADAFVAALTDGDFGSSVAAGSSTNVEGHILTLGYKVTKNFSVNTKAIFSEAIQDNSGEGDGELYQLDFVYKF